ncbi:hypothetical protein Poly21_33290 [Allorhodopirellula heiligendammensis]|uniref:Uncharacterized protein n=1 Tax=Allorhodopirellula heiligendammensis TaxID=2714739 RepID=A0A5C6BYY7_9BACT|nr:hypothetical protein Poly21_33290 [Allorhodopirellula heiligendammensis]
MKDSRQRHRRPGNDASTLPGTQIPGPVCDCQHSPAGGGSKVGRYASTDVAAGTQCKLPRAADFPFELATDGTRQPMPVQ